MRTAAGVVAFFVLLIAFILWAASRPTPEFCSHPDMKGTAACNPWKKPG